VVFSRDGTRLATGNFAGGVNIWDTATGEKRLALRTNRQDVRAVAFDPTGERIVAPTIYGARVWDAQTGQEVLTVTGHSSSVRGAAFSPRGTRFATASLDDTVRVWDAATGQPVATLRGHAGPVSAVAFAATLGPAMPTLAADHDRDDTGRGGNPATGVHLQLTPSSQQLAQCLPNADVDVTVRLTTDRLGYDIVDLTARHIAPNRDYTVFLLEQAGSPFGAAEYIGDLSTDGEGNGHAEFRLVVQEAFASTLVNGQRVRVDLNRVGMWFADPQDDDFCLGPNSPVTPFDGDNEAGVQAFNSANADPLPAP
jgi:WD40 repeat protein